tara:strand:- start:818 stop:919 length:102 start_codon:yes stop_codon:yes gene_type:complete
MPSAKALLQAALTTIIVMAVVNRVPQLKAITAG